MLPWIDVVEGICTRPAMYIGHGATFGEVAAWLEGFYCGLKQVNSEAVKEWDAFEAWLQKRFDYAPNIGWPRIFLDKFPEDTVAIEQLWSLFKQFVGENRHSTS